MAFLPFYFPLALLDVELHPKCRIRASLNSLCSFSPPAQCPASSPSPCALLLASRSALRANRAHRMMKGKRRTENFESERHESACMVKVPVTFCLTGDRKQARFCWVTKMFQTVIPDCDSLTWLVSYF